MKLISILLEINWVCILPMLGWMLGTFILGWLLRHLFGGNNKAKLLLEENNNLKVQHESVLADYSARLSGLEVKHNAVLDDHINLKSKFESVSADAGKLPGLIADIGLLKTQLTEANNKPPVTIEKKVEVPVEKIVEKIVEKRVEVPVEKIVEKKVEDMARINSLNQEITSLKAALQTANNKPPVVVEKIVERIVEKRVEVPMAVVAVAKDYKTDSELYGKKIKADDLKLVEGIGPKIEELFHNAGLKTWLAVAATDTQKLKEILVAGGERFQMHDPSTWPKQCQMMVDDKWAELKIYQEKLDGGKEN